MNARPFLIPLIILGASIMGILPVNAEKTGGYMAVEAGHGYVLVLKHDGSLWGWGSNFAGQLADSTWTNRDKPVRIMEAVSHFSAGPYHAFAIDRRSRLWG